MDDRKRHLSAVEKQFSQQAEAYSEMAVVRSAEIIQSAITTPGVQKRGTVLDVACLRTCSVAWVSLCASGRDGRQRTRLKSGCATAVRLEKMQNKLWN